MADDLSAAKRETVVRFLRDTADRIEEGELPADAAVIVVSEGDVHRPGSIGYRDGQVWVNARQSLHYHLTENDPSPEDRAEWRAEQERQRQADQDVYERTHPWKCACNQRFKTHRGWKSHRGAHRRRWGDGQHDSVVEINAPEPEPPVQLFPQSS